MNWDDFTLADLEAKVPLQILERGISYFAEGHLLNCCRLDNLLAGVLIGAGGKYEVRIILDKTGLQGECSCPYNGFCKHMTALTYGWLMDKSKFINLRPAVEAIIGDTGNLVTLFQRLIQKEPISFLALVSDDLKHDFISARGISNLIRNTFSSPYLTVSGVDSIWEKLNNIRNLTIAKLKEEAPNTPELIVELLSGLETVPDNCRNEAWVQFLQEFLYQITETSLSFSSEYLLPVKEKLLSMYFNPVLWEFSTGIRNILIKFNENDLENLIDWIGINITPNTPLLTLVLAYELLAEMPLDIEEAKVKLEKIEQTLKATPEGFLWVIDRLMEQDSEQAFKLAKHGSRTFPADKRSFRERQINIHLNRGELKQAAALSFIQFQDQPNFEEYLRLKKLLLKYPGEWDGYYKRTNEFLAKNDQLRIRIMLVEGDIKEIQEYLNQIIKQPDLLFSTAEILETVNSIEVLPVYPFIIKALIAQSFRNDWKMALKLMVSFKKQSRLQNNMEEWDQLRRDLQVEYEENPYFQKKFGSILVSF